MTSYATRSRTLAAVLLAVALGASFLTGASTASPPAPEPAPAVVACDLDVLERGISAGEQIALDAADDHQEAMRARDDKAAEAASRRYWQAADAVQWFRDALASCNESASAGNNLLT